MRSASRTVWRPTLNCLASSASEGSLSPGFRTPSKTSALIFEEISSKVLLFSTGVNSALSTFNVTPGTYCCQTFRMYLYFIFYDVKMEFSSILEKGIFFCIVKNNSNINKLGEAFAAPQKIGIAKIRRRLYKCLPVPDMKTFYLL